MARKKLIDVVKNTKSKDKFMSLKERINKKFPKMIQSAYDLDGDVIARIPSGVFSFDMLTGGGIPVGKVTGLNGLKSSGKTTLALILCGNFLRMFPDMQVLYGDIENSYVPEWARNFIPDKRRFHLLRPDYGEQALDISLEAVRSPDTGLIVLDSLAMLVPTAEADSPMEDNNVGLQARMFNKFIRKFLPIWSKRSRSGNPITVIWVNQLRRKVGGMTKFGAPQWDKPAGHFQDFVYALDIRMYNAGYDKEGTIPVLSKHEFSIEKNKMGLPKRRGEYSLSIIDHDGLAAGQPDDLETVITYGKRSGIIERVPKGWLIGKTDYSNLEEVHSFYQENPKALDKLRTKVLESCIKDVFMSGVSNSEESVEETEQESKSEPEAEE